ncbi:terpenoid synthase [Epithele typhae]|uniref:terpenoid synthase n=1 Tax=Epithele typhae TaxID=378194 RepID=UPI0020078DF5|nr:terpenoid synthase [Epithele typhae]KAH9928495.1 terpenoid synthase [Epithele typhae]
MPVAMVLPAPLAAAGKPAQFALPDLVGHCTFPLTYHPAGDATAAASVAWLASSSPEIAGSPRALRALHGLRAGELTAMCYPTCAPERLRVVSDFMYFLFRLDDISDGMVRAGTQALADAVMNALWFPDRFLPTEREFWVRCTRDAKPGPQARFKEHLELFFEAVHQQARDRDAGSIPDLESYINVRRDTSGCRPVFDLIEYAADIDLPECVVAHPTIRALSDGANDLVTCAQDIFSYNKEQARGDTHNMIVILMKLRGCDLQTAVDSVGDLCRQTIDAFVANQRALPSFGPKIDRDVALYVRGLQDWIVGSLHWSFESERYFGKSGAKVKKLGIVKLLPRRDSRPAILYFTLSS